MSAGRLLARGALAAAAALVALLITEVLLRVAAAADAPPLFIAGDDGRLHRNPDRPEVVDVAVDAHPDRLRVVWLGDSTVVGVPYDPQLSPPRWLQWILAERGVRAEVVGLAGAGLDAAQVAGLVREALELRPDVVVVTTGHNEFLTAGPALHPHWWQMFWLGRLLQRAIAPYPGAPRPGEEPDHAAVAARCATSLQQMAADCAADGVPLLLTTPVCNLADMPPVLGGPAAGGDADAAFERGRELLAAGELLSARAAFVAARDLDRWPHRASSELEAAVRAAAPVLVPADAAFAQASATGCPGDDLFADHCHPNPAGQRLLALAVADALEDLHVAPPTGQRGKAPPLEAGLSALGGDAAVQARAQAQVGRVFAGLALLREQPGPLAARAAELLLDPALDAQLEPAELALSRTLLALAQRDCRTGSEQLALTSAHPRALARLREMAGNYAWIADGFRRCGLAVP